MSKSAVWIRKRTFSVAVAIFGITIFGLLGLFAVLFREFNHDEFEAIHTAWKIFSGEQLYVDFLQTHHFLLYYLLVPMITAFGPGIPLIVAARVLMLAMSVGIVFLTYRISLMLYGEKNALYSIFFLVTSVTFLTKAIEIRPDTPLVLSELLSAFLLFSYFQTGSVVRLFGSSVALFVAFLFLQKAVFMIGLIGILFIYRLCRRKILWRDFFAYFGIFAVLLAGFVAYVSTTFGWQQYFFTNWELNTQLLNIFPLYKYLLRSAEQNPLLWIFFVAGIVHAARSRVGNASLLFGVGLLATVFVTKTPFPQYYLASMPWIAMIAASVAARSERLFPKFITLILTLSLPVAGYFYYELWEDSRAQLAKVSYVLSITGPNDFVYDGNAEINLFRKDLDYFWFSVKPKTGLLSSYRLLRPCDYDLYRLIDEKHPKVVSSSFVKTKDPSIADHYEKSQIFEDLYLRKEE